VQHSDTVRQPHMARGEGTRHTSKLMAHLNILIYVDVKHSAKVASSS